MSRFSLHCFIVAVVFVAGANQSSATVVFNAGFEYAVEPTSSAIGNDAGNLNGMIGQVGTFSGAIPDGIVDAGNPANGGNFAPDLMGFENAPGGGRLLWVDRAVEDGSFNLNLTRDVKLNDNATVAFQLGSRRTQNTSNEKDYDIIGFDDQGNESFHLRVSTNNNTPNQRRVNAIVDGGTLITNLPGAGDANDDLPNIGNPPFTAADLANIELTLGANGFFIDFARATDIYTSGLINYNGNATTLSRVEFAFNGDASQLLASGFILDNILINGDLIVPEPTTATLGLIGLCGLALRRRRAA